MRVELEIQSKVVENGFWCGENKFIVDFNLDLYFERDAER